MNPDYTHGYFSSLVYEDPKNWGSKLSNEMKSKGWKVLSYSNDDHGGWNKLGIGEESTYMGGAFINEKTGQLIIAHRGTQATSAEDWLNNMKHYTGMDTLVLDTSDHLKEAEAFTQKIMNSPNIKNYDISHAGHSKGGFIATIMGTKHKQPVVGFDTGPEPLDHINRMMNKGEIDQSHIDYASKNTQTYLIDGSAMDAIVDGEGYPGSVTEVDLIDTSGPIDRHSIDNILKEMDQNDGSFNKSKQIKGANEYFKIDFTPILEEIRSGSNLLASNIT